MKSGEKIVDEILRIQKAETKTYNYGFNTAPLFLIGFYSVKNPLWKVNLDDILNSSNSKEAFKEALDIIGEEVKELKKAVSYFKNIDLSSDEINKILVVLKSSFFNTQQYSDAFEYMLKRIPEKATGDETTSDFINKLAVEIIEPKEGDFYDGAFGLGGSAIEAYNFSAKYENELKIYGQEINGKTYAVACVRMFINGINSVDIRRGDTLTNPAFVENNNLKKFNTIIMSLPFALSWKDKEIEILKDKYGRFIYGMPGAANAEWLFIPTAIKSLKEDGKAVIITNLGTLFRAGGAETVRKNIIGFDYIETVIELPSGLFMNTNASAAMIVFNMKKSKDMINKIQFINADEIYENVRRGKRILNDENINTILDIYRNKKDIEGRSAIVGLEYLDNGNILPSKYVVKTEFESSDYGKVKIHLDKLDTNKTLGDIGSFYRGINVTSKNVQDPNGNYKIINLADIKDGELDVESLPSYSIENNARVEAYKVQAGDIIISNKGATKVCIIPEHDEDILISQNFIGIRLKSNYNPEYIKEFLESPIGEYLIDSRKTGTAVSMINVKDLKEIPVVEMDLKKQDEIINNYNEEEKELQKKMDELKEAMNKLKFKLYKEMDLEDIFEIID